MIAPTFGTRPAGCKAHRELTLMSIEDATRKTLRVVPAPAPENPRLRPAVLDVECSEDEDVEWYWTETTEGRFVSGYRIVPRAGTAAL
jgi:hypothetical protein